MVAARYNVLFLCTGNSARSIMAEAFLNHTGGGRFQAFSAGSHPAGQVNLYALEQLRAAELPIEGLRSKSWDEFAVSRAPPLDFVFTVCDNAAGEVCPIWLGQPITAHWGMPDPAAVNGTEAEIRQAFLQVFTILSRRIDLFTRLSLDMLDQRALKSKLAAIGTVTA
jgi:arsenate reductase (thioredoxin)